MHAASSLILNAAKRLAGIPQGRHVLPEGVIHSIGHLKKDILGRKRISLDAEEALIALAISATSDPSAEASLAGLRNLRGCEVHMTHMPSSGDEAGLRKLGVNLTTEPRFASNRLFAS
jgi:uncharacterized protein (UPF0371 family)